MNPCLLSVHNHQVILEKVEARENINHDEYVEEEDYLLSRIPTCSSSLLFASSFFAFKYVL